MRSASVLKILAVTALGIALASAAGVEQGKGAEKAPAKKAAAKPVGGKQASGKPAGDKANGEEVFKANCAVCHYADKTDRRLGPGLLGIFKKEKMENGKPVNEANVRETIREGYGKMIAFKEKLDDQQLADLLAYLRTL